LNRYQSMEERTESVKERSFPANTYHSTLPH
ncbi:hypothetical protein D046_6155B, partial [Vibrio parahaemolyticus V-223/04]